MIFGIYDVGITIYDLQFEEESAIRHS